MTQIDPASGDATAAPPNLFFLKALTAVLGLLLLAGFALVAVLIARGPSDAGSRGADGFLPAIPLAEGETIIQITAGDDRLYALIQGENGRHILAFIPEAEDEWVRVESAQNVAESQEVTGPSAVEP